MSAAFGSPEYQEKAKATLVSLVTALLRDKPKDPVSLGPIDSIYRSRTSTCSCRIWRRAPLILCL